MCDTFNAINDWDSQIVGRVSFVGGPSSVVRNVFTSVKDWVSQAFNFVLHVELSSDAKVLSFTTDHIVEVL